MYSYSILCIIIRLADTVLSRGPVLAISLHLFSLHVLNPISTLFLNHYGNVLFKFWLWLLTTLLALVVGDTRANDKVQNPKNEN
jgi:hypothetical protein